MAAFDAAAQGSSITFRSSFASVVLRLGDERVRAYTGVRHTKPLASGLTLRVC
jgi:hypothetical protein